MEQEGRRRTAFTRASFRLTVLLIPSPFIRKPKKDRKEVSLKVYSLGFLMDEEDKSLVTAWCFTFNKTCLLPPPSGTGFVDLILTACPEGRRKEKTERSSQKEINKG